MLSCEFLSNFCRFTNTNYNIEVVRDYDGNVVNSFQIFVDLQTRITTRYKIKRYVHNVVNSFQIFVDLQTRITTVSEDKISTTKL